MVFLVKETLFPNLCSSLNGFPGVKAIRNVSRDREVNRNDSNA